MRKIFSIIFTLLLIGQGFAQKYKAVIDMKNGSFLEGEMFHISADDTKLKLYETGKKGVSKYIELNEVETVKFYTQDGIVIFESLMIFKDGRAKDVMKKPSAGQIVYAGENITLYMFHLLKPTNPNLAYGRYFGVKRKGDQAAAILTMQEAGTLNSNAFFRTHAYEYFNRDCPELAQKIKNKTYKHKDILEVVKEYDRIKSK